MWLLCLHGSHVTLRDSFLWVSCSTGFSKGNLEELKLKEIKNARLAMVRLQAQRNTNWFNCLARRRRCLALPTVYE